MYNFVTVSGFNLFCDRKVTPSSIFANDMCKDTIKDLDDISTILVSLLDDDTNINILFDKFITELKNKFNIYNKDHFHSYFKWIDDIKLINLGKFDFEINNINDEMVKRYIDQLKNDNPDLDQENTYVIVVYIDIIKKYYPIYCGIL